MRLNVKSRLSLSILLTSLLMMGAAVLAMVLAYYDTGLREATLRVEDMARDAEDDGDMDARGDLVLEEDVRLYSEGVTVVFLNADGMVLAGAYPLSFPADVAVEPGRTRVVDGTGSGWIVCDLASDADDGFVVRALMSLYELDNGTRQMAVVAGGLVIGYALVMALLSWLMARRAFRPVERLTRHARSIRSGGQLDERLPVPPTRDEIADLADTFNAMFARLDESFRAERQFTSDVSHELRTPVGAILAQCEMGLSGDDADRRQALEAIHQRAQHMSALVSRLLMLARAEQGRQVLSVEQLDMRELCALALAAMEDAAQARGVTLELEPGDDAPVIEGDEALVVSLLTNLVGNAVKYSDPDKARRYVRVRVSGGVGQACITVCDNGIGMASGHLGRIFDRFYRVDSARAGDSTGLGLCLCAWIARAHGGSIDVQSAEGEGSCFTVRLTGAAVHKTGAAE